MERDSKTRGQTPVGGPDGVKVDASAADAVRRAMHKPAPTGTWPVPVKRSGAGKGKSKGKGKR
jgi:hypothetical protein